MESEKEPESLSIHKDLDKDQKHSNLLQQSLGSPCTELLALLSPLVHSKLGYQNIHGTRKGIEDEEAEEEEEELLC